jgi:hypothetical protein
MHGRVHGAVRNEGTCTHEKRPASRILSPPHGERVLNCPACNEREPERPRRRTGRAQALCAAWVACKRPLGNGAVGGSGGHCDRACGDGVERCKGGNDVPGPKLEKPSARPAPRQVEIIARGEDRAGWHRAHRATLATTCPPPDAVLFLSAASTSLPPAPQVKERRGMEVAGRVPRRRFVFPRAPSRPRPCASARQAPAFLAAARQGRARNWHCPADLFRIILNWRSNTRGSLPCGTWTA